MNMELYMEEYEIKPVIRSLLLSLGSSCTESEFRKVYAEIEGEKFERVLRNLNLDFFQMMTQIPDTCRVNYSFDGELTIHRVSTANAKHIETLVKRSRRIVRPLMRSSAADLQSFITDETFRIPLPKMTDEATFFDIILLDVSSPTKFTFQFNSEALATLSAKMKELYESLENQTFYRVKIISNGMIVVVNHRSKWFRAQVVSASREGATVLPLDCLTLEPKEIEFNNIFYLHKSFSTETQKSAHGQIYGIMPIEKDKITQSNDELKKFSLKGTATVKKLKDNVYFLKIVDPVAKANLVDTLHGKNLAVPDQKDLDNENFHFAALK